MDEETIDLRDILRILKKRSGLILRFFFGAALLALVISLVWPKTYEAESTLRIKQAKGLGNSLLGDVMGGSSMATKQLMSTYSEILKSRTVVTSVIEQVYGELPENEKPDYDTMLKRITTQPVKDTEILKVKVTARTAEESALLTDTLVATFNDRLTELVRTEQRAVRGFIGERLAEARKELEKAEADLTKYKSEQKILAPAEETKALVAKLSDFDKLAASNKVALSMAQAKLNTADTQLAGQHPGFVADNPTIQQYKTGLVENEVKLVELLQRYTEKHPQVVTTRKTIAQIKTNLVDEAAKVAKVQAPSSNVVFQGLLTSRIQAEAEVAAAGAQQQAIRRVMAEGESEVAKLPAKEQGLTRLLRDAAVAQEIYVMLAKRHEEARIAEVMEATDVQLVDVATVPEKPIKPRVVLNTIIGALLGLFGGLGLAFALEYLNRSIRTAEDVRQYLELPVLGNIPDFDRPAEKTASAWQKLRQRLKGQGR